MKIAFVSRMLLAALLVLPLAGCASSMPPELLLEKIRDKSAPLIVDVRSQGEFERDHVPGAVHIPFYAVRSGLKQRGYGPQETIVLYCEHGPRAGIAGLTLQLFGYEHLFTLNGHMQGWRAAGLPVESGGK